jgi:hypothetical protein
MHLLLLLIIIIDINNTKQINPDRTDEKDLENNREVLINAANAILKLIYQSIDRVPASIRRILRNLFRIIDSVWGKHKALVAVGGFFFLRFLCPSIVSPEKYLPSSLFI